jgi:hypothetical protein
MRSSVTPGARARQAVGISNVALLAAVLPPGGTGSVPDLLTPKPPAHAWSHLLDDQLDLINATPGETVARQVVEGSDQDLPAVESGTFARRAANGLYRLWRDALADECAPAEYLVRAAQAAC